VLLEAACETDAKARQAAAAGGVVGLGGSGRAGWDVGDGAGGLEGEDGGLGVGCQLGGWSVKEKVKM
jgi:hypothetical protein